MKNIKKLSIKEFTKAAGRYESSHAGIYEMCKKELSGYSGRIREGAFLEIY